MSDDYLPHYSVLKEECITFLSENAPVDQVSYFADLTFGAGGHSLALLGKSDKYILKSVDQDPDALKNGKEIIERSGFVDRIELLASNFESFPQIVEQRFSEIVEKEGGFQGILMDLGVSSHHFDKNERGFSFRFDAPLDMRMNPDNQQIETAADIVNSRSEEELTEIFSEYGEERFSKRIAERIVEKREEYEIKTTKQLEDIIFHAYPKKMRFGRINPSTRCFQALRIVVNRELDVLENVIPKLIPLLKSGGRLAIISFHSLEDRIVKRSFKSFKNGALPCKILTKKPITPSEKEIGENSRSRSAKLRVIEKL